MLLVAAPPLVGPGKRARHPGLGKDRARPAQTQPRPSSVGTPRRVAPGGQATRAAMTRGSRRSVACAACRICGIGARAHTCGMCNQRVCGGCFWHANGLCSNCSNDPGKAPPLSDHVAAAALSPPTPPMGAAPCEAQGGWAWRRRGNGALLLPVGAQAGAGRQRLPARGVDCLRRGPVQRGPPPGQGACHEGPRVHVAERRPEGPAG